MSSIDRHTYETAFVANFGQTDTSEYYDAHKFEGSGTLFWNTLYLKASLDAEVKAKQEALRVKKKIGK